MKKKLLSLVLAGAMVASTSVSAFAAVSQTPAEATGRQDVKVTDTESEASINIEGRIADNKDVLPPSTISVTVPTAATFTVDKNGNLIGSTINITSQGDGEVKVMAQKFTDITKTEGINVVDTDTLNTENGKQSGDRKMVSLKLRGNEGTVSLKTEADSTGSGIYKLNTTQPASEEEKTLGKIKNGQTLTLTLEGDAVKVGEALGKSVSDNFTLTLKIKKVNS